MSTPIPLNAQPSFAHPPACPRPLSLPAELVDFIIENVCVDDIASMNDLKTLSLVSRWFTPACQKLIFETAVLQPAKFVLDNEEHIGPETHSRFARS